MKCRRRGHRWRVIGWGAGITVAQPDQVYIECKRCGRAIAADVVLDRGGVQ